MIPQIPAPTSSSSIIDIRGVTPAKKPKMDRFDDDYEESEVSITFVVFIAHGGLRDSDVSFPGIVVCSIDRENIEINGTSNILPSPS